MAKENKDVNITTKDDDAADNSVEVVTVEKYNELLNAYKALTGRYARLASLYNTIVTKFIEGGEITL